MTSPCFHCAVLILLCSAHMISAQEEISCYGPGSIALSVILTLILTVFLCAAFYWWKKYRNRKRHLILETDPETGKAEFAFDNPGFKDASVIASEKTSTIETPKQKWNQWSPFSALTLKSEKRKTLDDSALQDQEVKVVALRSHDFTGLGFNICGNMKDGIFIKDILHRGPAFESGKLSPGDRIKSVTISFEHMVYEDALTILSYASPYEVMIEAKGERPAHSVIHGQSALPTHPVYRSSSCMDLYQVGKSTSKKRLFVEDQNGSYGSNYSSLQKSKSNMTTLERKESKSPKPSQFSAKKTSSKHLTPEQLKHQLEQRISVDHQTNLRVKERAHKIEAETQKTENSHQKFGIRVLPTENHDKSPKIHEQNENNINIERYQDEDTPMGGSIDEVDKTPKQAPPQAKRREKKQQEMTQSPETPEQNFERNSQQGSLIKRDENGIPQELPSYMFSAAMAARNNRKSTDDKLTMKDEETPRKLKGKAPIPPMDPPKTIFDEINPLEDEMKTTNYNSDSDMDHENHSSVNTIELNSSDITIHQTEEQERQNRKTASTGDLSKLQRTRKPSSGTLERAQSLDITDAAIPTLTMNMKSTRNLELKSDEDLFGTAVLNKEPRLSLILDGLNTFQRNRLKKSTEWGNLEDAILKLNQEEGNSDSLTSLEDSSKPEFDAVVNKINEIKRESQDIATPIELEVKTPPKPIKNNIWPVELDIEQPTTINTTLNNLNPIKLENIDKPVMRRQQVPVVPERILPPSKNDEPIAQTRQRTTSVEKRQRTIVPDGVVFDPPPIETIEIIDRASERQKTPEDVWEIPVSEILTNTSPPPSLEIAGNLVEEPSHNTTDEIKTNLRGLTQNFLYAEQMNIERDDYKPSYSNTNISDDIKVSRHTFADQSTTNAELLPKCDDAKTEDLTNISHVTVTENGAGSNLHSLELSINDPNDLYTTALEDAEMKSELVASKVTISTPDLIKNVTLTEAITALNEPSVDGTFHAMDSNKNSSLTYITEIQVTPNETNVSEIEIIPNGRNLESEFENYVKNFESKLENFEENVHNFETNLEEFIKEEPKSILLSDSSQAEKEVHKIQEIAEEQLKKLPEMRFTTSSYESGFKTPEKRHSFEALRSNFEKSPPKKETTPKSRIPIATTTKTPPTSPERRDSKNLDNENEKAILELMSSSIHSTPYVTSKIKPPNKNVTVTSIRSNSKLPSGLPTLSGGKPPIPPKRTEGGVNISTNGGSDSSFKQWVFTPGNVTNVTVENKDKS